jgi:hypothetical protein
MQELFLKFNNFGVAAKSWRNCQQMAVNPRESERRWLMSASHVLSHFVRIQKYALRAGLV